MLKAVSIIADITSRFGMFFLINELAYKSIIYPEMKSTTENTKLK
jgi:hypothetical protein